MQEKPEHYSVDCPSPTTIGAFV